MAGQFSAPVHLSLHSGKLSEAFIQIQDIHAFRSEDMKGFLPSSHVEKGKNQGPSVPARLHEILSPHNRPAGGNLRTGLDVNQSRDVSCYKGQKLVEAAFGIWDRCQVHILQGGFMQTRPNLWESNQRGATES